MSSSITERASELRASAISLIIRDELEAREIKRLIESFKVVSTTSEELSDKERIELLKIRNRIKGILEQLILALTETCSAISASIQPLNSAATISTVINITDNTKGQLTEIEEKMKIFEENSEFSMRKGAVLFISDKLIKISTDISNALNKLHILLLDNVAS